MKPKARMMIVSSQTIRLLVTFPIGLCAVAMALAQPATGLRNDAQAHAGPRISRLAFQRLSGPVRKIGVSGAERSGSFVRGAQLVRETFELRSVDNGGAVVQVVTFPKEYAFAAHDSFGSLLLTTAYDKKLSGPGDLSTAAQDVQSMQWEYADKTRGGTICYVQKGVSENQNGSVRWLAGAPETGIVSVGIGFRNTTGLPGMLIDKYLHKYPSTVPANPTWHHDWEAKDIEKWKVVLNASKGDMGMLQAGAAYLMRYDKRSFGLLDCLNKHDDPVAFSNALDGVKERMTRWIDERKKASQSSKRGD